jgi:GNAT superfamily N-acetyltransferase
MEDPIYVGILPDADERRRSMQALWQAVIRTCRPYGRVETTPDLAGVTCWLAPGHADLNAWQVLRTALALPRAMMSWPSAARRRFLQLVSDVDHIRQERLDRPCWYLWALGVEPARQGQGIGGALLDSVHRLADEQRLPCYLETETEGNVWFYARRGYQVIFEGEIVGLRLWSLLRQPQHIGA